MSCDTSGSFGAMQVLTARRTFPIFNFEIPDDPNGVVKSFYGSAKRSSGSSLSNLNSKRGKRTVLEDMIFNKKIPPAILTATDIENNLDLQKG